MLDSLVASGLAIRVALLPPPHDPDSYIKQNGSAAFQQLIQQAPGFFDFYLDRLCATHDVRTDKGQLSVSRAMSEALHKTGSSLLLDKYAQKTALRLGVSSEATRTEFRKPAKADLRFAERFASAPAPEESTPVAKPTAQEFWLLKILLLHEDLAEWLSAHLDAAWIQHPVVRAITARRLTAQANQSWTGAAGLLTDIEDEGTRQLITEILAEDRPVPNPQQQLSDIVLRLRNYSIDRQMAGLVQRAGQTSLSETERIQALQELQELRQAKARPLP